MKTVVASILDVSAEEVSDDLGPETNGNWDSLNHMNIITAVEKEFDIAMSMADVQSIVDFSTLKSVVEKLS